MSMSVIYGDPAADGHHVVIEVGFMAPEVNLGGWSSDPAGIWHRPILEYATVTIDGKSVGYLPCRGETRGLTEHDYPVEVSTKGVVRIILMQTNPLPEIIRDLDNVTVEYSPVAYDQIRVARVQFPAASVTVVGANSQENFVRPPSGDTDALFVPGDRIRDYQVGDQVTTTLPD